MKTTVELVGSKGRLLCSQSFASIGTAVAFARGHKQRRVELVARLTGPSGRRYYLAQPYPGANK